MLFGKRRRHAATRPPGQTPVRAQPEEFVVAYEQMLKGSTLTRRGRPIRQVAVVVQGTVRLITSGDTVDRKTYEALVLAGVLPGDEKAAVPDVLEDGAAVTEETGDA